MTNAYSFCNGCWKHVHNKIMKINQITNSKVMTRNKDNKISKQMRMSLKIIIETTNNNKRISKKDSRNNNSSSKIIKLLKMCTRQRFRIIKKGTNLLHPIKDNSNNNNNRNNKKMNFHPL